MTAAQRRKKNRENGRKSQGPVTQEGRDISRRSALKHGLTAKVLTLPGEDPDQIQVQADRFFEALQPESHDEEVLVDQIALASLQLERLAKAQTEILAEQVRKAEIRWDLNQNLRLLKLRRLLRRDRSTAILKLRTFGAGVSWLLGRWRSLETAFNASQCWNNLAQIREALLLRGFHDDRLDARTGSGYEFAHLAVSCIEGHENLPEFAQFLASCDDEGMPCIKNMTEFHQVMASYAPDECLNRMAVRAVSLTDARRVMRTWIERQIADLRELDRHFREADAKSRAGAKVRANVLADTRRNRLLIRYTKSTETSFDRTLKTLTKLQKDRQKATEIEAKREASEARKAGFPNEPNVMARSHSNGLFPGGYVTLLAQKYVVVEKSDGNVILSQVEPMVAAQPLEVAATSENGV
jgi:hypothetical protein